MELDSNMHPMDESLDLSVWNFDKPWICTICNYNNEGHKGRCRMCKAFHPGVELDYNEKVAIKNLLMSVSKPCYEETFEIFMEHGFDCWKALEVMKREDLKEMNVKVEYRKSIWFAIRLEMRRRKIEKTNQKIEIEISRYGGIIFKNLTPSSD